MTVNEYNYAQLRQASRALAETARHNLAGEEIERGKLYETQRHQMASEAIDRSKVDETIRHDTSMEGIQRRSNAITDWYNRQNIVQGEEKLRQSNLTSTATAAKTTKETGLMDRSTEASIYSLYTQANARADQAKAAQQNADTNLFNAKVNAVLNTGKWITGTLTDLGSMISKGTSTFNAKQSTSKTSMKQKAEDSELTKYLKSKGYWY